MRLRLYKYTQLHMRRQCLRVSIVINRAEHALDTKIIKHKYMFMCNHKIIINIIGYEPAGLTMHPPPKK